MAPLPSASWQALPGPPSCSTRGQFGPPDGVPIRTLRGTRLLTGRGKRSCFDRGHYVDLADFTGDMTNAREEILGPPTARQAHDDVDDPVRLPTTGPIGGTGSVQPKAAFMSTA